MLPSSRSIVRSFDNGARPFFTSQPSTFMGFFPIARGNFVVVNARSSSVVYAYNPNRSTNAARLEPDRWSRQKLRREEAEIQRVCKLGKKVCRRSDNLVGFRSIVNIWVMLQDCSEESIGRHVGTFNWFSEWGLLSMES